MPWCVAALRCCATHWVSNPFWGTEKVDGIVSGSNYNLVKRPQETPEQFETSWFWDWNHFFFLPQIFGSSTICSLLETWEETAFSSFSLGFGGDNADLLQNYHDIKNLTIVTAQVQPIVMTQIRDSGFATQSWNSPPESNKRTQKSDSGPLTGQVH